MARENGAVNDSFGHRIGKIGYPGGVAMDQRGCQGPGSSEGAHRATFEPPGMIGKGSKRFSARRKTKAFLRLLQGERLELLFWGLGLLSTRYQAGGKSFFNPNRPFEKRPRMAKPEIA